MAFTDSRDPRGDLPAQNVQDVIPPTERGQDPVQTELTHELTAEGSRPLTDEERKAADRATSAGQTVYAPASARVPVNPVPGHREFVEHPDTHTPEREAAGTQLTEPEEPSFSRVARPTTSPTPEPYASSSTTSDWATSANYTSSWDSAGSTGGRNWLGMRMAWLMLGIGSGVGVWLWVSALDWQKRLTRLKDRWTPGRVELEKISISRR
ncbi:MAG: hypothetical protein LC797_09965 [Chloroflexi bacterium]|nr:hypothetical protein [Chloroflexota bacterium]